MNFFESYLKLLNALLIIIDSYFFPTVYHPFKILWRYINVGISCFLYHLLSNFIIFFFECPVLFQCILYFIIYRLTEFHVMIRNYWNLILIVLLIVLNIFTRTELIKINLLILEKLISIFDLNVSEIVKLLPNFNSNIFFFINFSLIR